MSTSRITLLVAMGLSLIACSSPPIASAELEAAKRALQSKGFGDLSLSAVVVRGDDVRLDFLVVSKVTPQRFAQGFDIALRSVAEVLSQHPHLRFSYTLDRDLEQPLQSQAICLGAPMYAGFNGRAKPSSLAQARVLLNPGHGRYLRNGSWLLQRPIPPSLGTYVQEDTNNLEQAIAVRDAVQTTGATVWAVRELDKAAGNGVSGYPKWQEAAKHYLEATGVPEGVWNSERDATEGDCALEKDIRSRALQANYLGADALVGLHTNAGGGRGTLTFYSHQPAFSDTPSNWVGESQALSNSIHTAVVASIRQARPDLNWPQGQVIGVPQLPSYPNYGELRFSKSPAALVEVGFHDSPIDGPALDDSDFQRAVGEGIRMGLQSYFGAGSPELVFPQSPQLVMPGSSSTGEVLSSVPITFSWKAVQGATRYGLYISKAPYGPSNLVYSNENIPSPATSLQLNLSDFHQTGITQYRWNMTAFSGPGDTQNGSFSSHLYFSVPQAPIAPNISALSMSANGKILLVWPEVANATSYKIRVAFDSNPLDVNAAVPSTTRPINSAVLEFLAGPESADKQNKELCLSLQASGLSGDSPWSSSSCVNYRYYTGIQPQLYRDAPHVWLLDTK